jgi:protein-L-isoaspartate(D-aspartate) O-methyltransferase
MNSTSANRFWPALLLLAAGAGPRGPVYGGPPDYAPERAAMVERLRANGITNQRVLAAMRTVPRHLFVAEDHRADAYDDVEIPVGRGQVLHRPYVVALTAQLLDLKPGRKVLQVGVGCGYCTAVLAQITPDVYAADMRRHVVASARARLRALGYSSVALKDAQACRGWPDKAPYDAILVYCAADHVPEELVRELNDGGRMIVPIGRGPEQTLTCLRKTNGRLRSEVVMPIRVDPMICQSRPR